MGKAKRKSRGKAEDERAEDRAVSRDLLAIFSVTFLGALLLQKVALYCDWDTIDSVNRMNLAGYTPLGVPPVKYHLLIEPAVFALTSVLAPLLGRDHMIGFMVLVALFSAGLLALAYYTVYRLTGDRAAAFISTLFIAVSYNFLFLTLSVTQNIANQFFNLLTVLLALMLAGRLKTGLDRRILAMAVGLSIGLAVGTNLRSLYLLLTLPLIVMLGTDRKSSLKSAITAGLVALGAIACLAAASSLLGSSSGPADFFNVVYYSEPEFWFFAGPGNLAVQATNASIGFLRSLIGDSLVTLLLTASPYLPILAAIAVLGLFGYLLRPAVRDPAVLVIAALLLVNSVNSFFYEPVSLERWDHAVLFLALLLGIAWVGTAGKSNKILICLLLGLMALGLLAAYLALGSNTLFMSFLYGKLPAAEFSQHPGLLVVSPVEKAESAKYMVYLYGRENIRYVGDFGSADDLAAFTVAAHANDTLYLDGHTCQAIVGKNGTDPLLSTALPVDKYGVWYRIDKAGN